jgi:hypothetical protein
VNEVLPSLAGVLLFLLPGLGLTELIPVLRTLPWPRRLGYAYLLGLTAVAGSLYAGSHLCGLPLRRPAILAVAAGMVLVGLVARALRRSLTPLAPLSHRPPAARERGGKEKTVAGNGRGLPSPGGRGGEGRGAGGEVHRRRIANLSHRATLALLSFINLGLFADAVTNPATGWDERMIWSAQARYLRAAGTVDAEALRDARWYVDHPRYPLLLPVAQAAVLEVTGADEDRQVFRLIYAALFPALLLVFWDGAVRWAGAPAARLAALAAAGAPAFTFWQDGGAASAYSDLPLACLTGAALVLLLRSRRSLTGALTAGVFLAGAVLAKSEGALLAFFVPLAAAPLLLRRKDRKRQAARLLAAAVPALLALAFLASWRAGIPNRYDEGYAGFVKLGAFWPGIITKIPTLAPLAVRQMLAWDPWAAFWWIVPPVLAAGWRGFRAQRRPLTVTLFLAAAAPLAIGWGAYSVHWDPAPLLRVTWTRFLLQGSLPLLLLLALALRSLLGRRSGELARNSHRSSSQPHRERERNDST